MSIPQTTAAYNVHGSGPGAGTGALHLNNNQQVPQLNPGDVLVRLRAGSLNYRDLVIYKGTYPRVVKDGVVPGSDGSGEVIAVGSGVSRFKKGDRVITAFYQDFFGGPAPPMPALRKPWVILQMARSANSVFDKQGLLPIPRNLSFLKDRLSHALPLTAWNSLNGLQTLRAGDCVLTQDTGGVSIFALQFSVATGATVIATTSSDVKVKKLKELGAHHVINYRSVPTGEPRPRSSLPRASAAIALSESVVLASSSNSLEAIAPGGQIAVIGFLTGIEKVGNRTQFEERIRAIEVNDIHPVLYSTVFPLQQLQAAFQYQYEQKHFGKVVVSIP